MSPVLSLFAPAFSLSRRLTPRSGWLTLLALCVATATAVSVVLCSRPPFPSDGNLNRIKVGMSRHEVEAILGKPQGLFTGRIGGPRTELFWDRSLLRRRKDALVVLFDDGLVRDCSIMLGSPDDRSLWQRLRDRLRSSFGW